MDQYDYLTREQLLSLIRVLGTAREGDRGQAPGDTDGLPEFGERALREFENSTSPMRIYDRESLKYLAVNNAAVKFYGYTREEFLVLTLKDTRHPDDHAAQLAALKEPAGYFVHRKPRRHIKKSGEIVIVETVTQDILFNGRKARVSLTIDVTERKRAEEELKRQIQILDAVIDNLPMGVFIRDAKTHRYVRRNRFVQHRFGQGKEGFLGKTVHDLFPHEQAERFLESDRRLFETGRMEEIPEHRVSDVQTGATRIQHVRKVPLYDEKGEPWLVVGVADDITERKQAEITQHRGAELARLLESLARAANEALTPEAAMAACLERICRHGRWVLGRVETFDRGCPKEIPGKSIWYTAEGNRFDEFIRITEGHVRMESGPFIGRVLRERTAVWIEDWRQKTGYLRWEAAVGHGLRSAFAFPIIAGGEVVAIMEVFGEETRTPDPHIMGAAESIASQLARIVEREWAHQANARMAAMVESSQDAILSRALDGTILTWNPAAERLFGYTAAEIVGRRIEILYPLELKAEIFQKQQSLLQGNAPPAYETVRVAKDGRRVHVSTSPALILDSSGKICGVSTIIRDISERKLAEQKLLQVQQHLQVAVQGGNVGLWDWDVQAGIVYFSPEWKRQLGYEDHEVLSSFEEWESRVHPEDIPRVLATVKKLLEQPQADYQQEYRMRHKDGKYRWILSRASVQIGIDGTMQKMFGCHVDITAQKQAEAERLDNAMRQRDALVREVHHRIKNSLQGVVGLLRQKIRKNPALTADIEETISQLQSVALVYGLQETRPDGLVNLAEITDAICSSAGNLIGGRLERIFERQSQGPACVVAREAVSVAVALNELVINALKHQPARAGQKHVRIILRETADEAEIRISNRGHLPAGFDYHGGRAAGNGLELVRTLLAAPGGTITFNGARGEVEVVLKLSPPLLAERQRPSQGKR